LAFFAVQEPAFSGYEGIFGNLGGAFPMALITPLTASIPEEIIYRGFLISRLSNIFGHDGRRHDPCACHGTDLRYRLPALQSKLVGGHSGAFGRTHHACGWT